MTHPMTLSAEREEQAAGAVTYSITMGAARVERLDTARPGQEEGDATTILDGVLASLLALDAIRRTDDAPRDTGRDVADRMAMEEALTRLDRHVLPMLEGIRAAVIRELRAAGTSHAELANVMGVARPTAQARARSLEQRPHPWEEWASTGNRPA